MAALSEVIDGLDLNTGGYRVAARDFGSVSLDILMRGRARHRPDALVSAVPSGTRSLSYVIEIEGSSKDNTIALYTALLERMPKTGTAKNLVVTPSGATNAVTFVCNAVDGEMQMPYDLAFDAGNRAVVSFTLLCEPYAYGPETTAYSEVLNTPNLLVCTILGDFPTPLTIQHNYDASSHVRNIWTAALAPGSALTIDDLLQEAEGGTWTGGSTGDASNGVYHDGAARYNGSNTMATRWFYDDMLDPGTYLVMVRATMENAADDGAWTLYEALGVNYLGATSIPHTSTGLLMREFGLYCLPSRPSRGDVRSALSLGMRLVSATGEGHSAISDYLMILPTSWGFYCVSPDVTADIDAGSDIVSFRIEGDTGQCYLNDAGSFANVHGDPINAVGETRIAIFSQSTDSVPFHASTTTITYTPRYALWR